MNSAAKYGGSIEKKLNLLNEWLDDSKVQYDKFHEFVEMASSRVGKKDFDNVFDSTVTLLDELVEELDVLNKNCKRNSPFADPEEVEALVSLLTPGPAVPILPVNGGTERKPKIEP